MKMNGFALSLACVLFLSSCVASKKYKEALAREQTLTEQNNKLSTDVASLNSIVNQLNGSVSTLNSKVNDLQNENARLIGQVDQAGKNASELSKLANKTQQQLQDEQQRLIRMQQLMEQQRQVTENLRKKMTQALVNFKPEELSVSIKNGKVYVSLAESLLFPSGSAEVNPRGKEALGKLAQALNINPDINVLIEGHTDSLPIHGKYEDNWALSTARATSIVRVLTNNYKVDPVRVTASGRSWYEPVDANTTAVGRAHNRRTEIILAPKLDELMKLLNQAPASTSGGSN